MTHIEPLTRLNVQIDGQPLAEPAAASLGEVQVHRSLSVPALCELTFFDVDEALAQAEWPVPGATLRVSVEQEQVPLFSGQITAIEYAYGATGERRVRVRGYDDLHHLRKRQSVRAHVQTTLDELAAELIRDLGIGVQGKVDSPLWQRIIQWRQSDLELLTEIAESCGAYFTLEDDALLLFDARGAGAAVELTLGSSLLEVEIEANADPACREVDTLGWDPWVSEQRQGRSSRPRMGRAVAMDAGPNRVGAPGKRTLFNECAQSEERASALAQAELDRRVMAEVTLKGVAAGDARLRPGTPIDVAGLAPSLSGRYVLSAVIHRIDRREGFVTELDTSPPPAHNRPRATVTAIARVMDVDDPQSLGRVRVSLPSFGDLESEWLEVLCPAAGPDKGLVALPDVGDRVLLLLAQEDPAQGIVLGGLYGMQGPPDAGVEGGTVRRYTFVTPGGQRLRLDDEHKSIRLENSGGNYLQVSPGRARIANSDGSFVELARNRVRLHADADLEIEAPGKSVTIRAAKIDFEQG